MTDKRKGSLLMEFNFVITFQFSDLVKLVSYDAVLSKCFVYLYLL